MKLPPIGLNLASNLKEEASVPELDLNALSLPELKNLEKQLPTPKYRNPVGPEVTWSGLGRKPGWVTEALEDLAI